MKQPIKKTARKKVVINDAFKIYPSKNPASTDKRRTAKMLAAKRAKAKAAKRAEEALQNHQIKYVVVHSIGHSENISISALEQMNYDIIITPKGKIISHSSIDAQQKSVEIGLIGGYDEQGVVTDNHSKEQKDTLIALLMNIIEHQPEYLIMSAEQLNSKKKPNPSFSLNALVMARILDAIEHLVLQQKA